MFSSGEKKLILILVLAIMLVGTGAVILFLNQGPPSAVLAGPAPGPEENTHPPIPAPNPNPPKPSPPEATPETPRDGKGQIQGVSAPPAKEAKPANRPPTLAIAKVDPGEPKTGYDLIIDLQGDDPDGDALTYQYRQGTEGDWINLKQARLELKNLKPGKLIVEFRVVDLKGAASAVVQRTWTLAEAPPPKNLVGTPLRLEWHLKKGDTLWQELAIAQQPTYQIAGLPVKALIQYGVLSRLTVQSVDAAGNAAVQQRVEDVRLGKCDDLSRDMIAAALKKLPGTTFTIHLNNRMEVTNFEGGSDKIQVGGGNLLGAGFVQMTNLLERDAWREFAQLTFFQPNRPLRVGEKWSNRMTHSWGALGTWVGQAHYAYGGNQGPMHKFEYALQLAFQPGKQPGKNLGLISKANFQPPLAGGSILFDADKRKVVYAEERFRVRGAMAISILGQNTTVDVEEDQRIGVRLTDERPK